MISVCASHAQIMTSKYSSPHNINNGKLKEMAYFRSETGKNKMSLKYLLCQKVKKCSKINSIRLKGYRYYV